MAQGSQSQMPDGAFDALRNYKRGDDPEVLVPIEQAVKAVHGNPAARAALEQRLAVELGTPSSRDARAFVCRELAIIGSAASVPALTALLVDEDLSHRARNALERIPGPEADTALRDAIARTSGNVKIGIIHSIAVRRDPGSVPLLAKALADDSGAAVAAAKALGEIGTPEAARALEAFRGKGSGALRLAVADALLICAERLVASGERLRAAKLLEALTDASQAPHVRLAANRALSAAMRP